MIRKQVYEKPAASASKTKDFVGAIMPDSGLGERQIRVTLSTPTPDRVKDVMEPLGCEISNYKANPVVLADHDRKQPIGTAEVFVKSASVEAIITFAPLGASAKADEYCALAKAGVLNTVSPGFVEKDASPIKGGGVHIKSWELLEISVVSVPCQPEAVVTQRSLKAASENWKVGASRNLPLDEDSSWDGPAAAASIFEKAGFDGDSPDTSFARKGFLVYDSADPGKKGSYKLPFAKVSDGRLTAVASGIRAAASRLPQTDVPSDVADKARAVIDHYEAQMSDKSAPKGKIKDLYDVASLAYCLQQLGYIEDMAEWEREAEGDNSVVPGMLVEAMRQLGAALVAMTAEEVAELIGEDIGEKSAKSLNKAMSLFATKAGRTMSASNIDRVRKACAKIKEGHDDMASMMDEMDSGDEPGKMAPASDRGADIIDLSRAKRLREIEVLKLAAS